LRRVSSLPDNVTREQIPALLGPGGEDDVYALLTSWEALGILLYRKEVNIDLVDDFFSGPIVVSWRKLFGYVEAMRAEAKRETYFEWVQWLAERMMQRESKTPPVPAHIAHRDWEKLWGGAASADWKPPRRNSTRTPIEVGAIDRNRPGGSGEPPLPVTQFAVHNPRRRCVRMRLDFVCAENVEDFNPARFQ